MLPDDCDEAFVQDWVRYGLAVLGGYLHKHAAFQDFIDRTHEPKGESS